MVYITDLLDEPQFEDEVNRADIMACEDEATLAGWYTEMLETKARISAHVEAYRFTGTAEKDWLSRSGGKIAILALGLRLVEARMIELGFTPPYPVRDHRNDTIRNLEKKLTRAKQMLREKGVELVEP